MDRNQEKALCREMGVLHPGGEDRTGRIRGNALCRTGSFNRWVSSYASLPVLDSGEVALLASRARHGDRMAFERVMSHEVRLALWYAFHTPCPMQIEFDDLVQETLIGIMFAVLRYEPRGYTFSSYAIYYMRWRVGSFINDNATPMHIPASASLDSWRLDRMREDVYKHAGRRITSVDEMSDRMHSSPKRTKDMRNLQRYEFVPLDDADGLTGDEDAVENAVFSSLAAQAVEEVLSTLTDKEALVLRLRYGLGGCPEMSLGEIAELFNRSKERIRQIEKNALERLRYRERARLLVDFV